MCCISTSQRYTSIRYHWIWSAWEASWGWMFHLLTRMILEGGKSYCVMWCQVLDHQHSHSWGSPILASFSSEHHKMQVFDVPDVPGFRVTSHSTRHPNSLVGSRVCESTCVLGGVGRHLMRQASGVPDYLLSDKLQLLLDVPGFRFTW